MDAFIAQLEDLIEASEDIAALEISKQSLILACLTDEDEEADA